MIENVLTVHSGIWMVPCQVVKVVNPSIIRVDADLGWGISKKNLNVYIDKLWCPNVSTPGGKLALEWAKGELSVGTPLTLHSRWMLSLSGVVGLLYLEDGRTYTDVVVAAGHGMHR